jgi:uncharacterized Zn-binding protein involved in type VI secretion
MTADYFDAGFLALKNDVMAVVTPLQQATGAAPAGQDPESPPRPVHAARRVQQVAGAAGAALGLPLQLLNTGFALATSQISALLPPFPAAFLGSLYIGPPHGHTHPPSLIPPNPVPVPLPSLGPILLGTSIRVLIGGLPAARCGDIGMAVTCCGIVPAFEVKTGSSKVFIGGARAARAIDFCVECAPGGGAMDGLAKASMAIGMIGGAAGVVADLQDSSDSSAAGDAAMASAQALAAAMGAAQLALDAATMAIKQAMGKDIAVPPMQGMIALGNPKVLIGGFPMVNLPDPMQKLFEKLKAKFGKSKSRANADESEEGCKTC